jgi:hypothetical protein
MSLPNNTVSVLQGLLEIPGIDDIQIFKYVRNPWPRQCTEFYCVICKSAYFLVLSNCLYELQ